ncbi:MAG: polysaccharide biosynthesis/export family protein [Synechococcus sp.]
MLAKPMVPLLVGFALSGPLSCQFAAAEMRAFSPLLEEYGLEENNESPRDNYSTARLSPGDRIQLTIPADTEELFSGPYEVQQDGTIPIPFIGAFSVQGLTLDEIETLLVRTLENQELFLPGVAASVQILNYGSAIVHISGAVFDPGTTQVNQLPLELLAGGQGSAASIPGDAPRRLLTDAIRAAGGITPVADLSRVQLERNHRTETFDLRGVFEGSAFENPLILSGDRIVVPRQEFEADYARPSVLTPPTIQVFLSSTTVPATSNSQANEQGIIELPYGAHFSQVLGPANCLGGTSATNARRSAVLIRTERKTGQVFALDRKVEDLVRDSEANDENPFLMPGDLVACYDSAVTNFRDVFRIVGETILPIGVFWGLVR